MLGNTVRIIFLFAATILSTFNAQEIIKCESDWKEMQLNISEMSYSMFNAYNRTCDDNCVIEAKPSTSMTTRDYSALKGEPSINMAQACNEVGNQGFGLCYATSDVTNGDLRTVEVSKPMCLPYSCDPTSPAHASFLLLDDTNDALLGFSFDCPNEREINAYDDSQCQLDARTVQGNNRMERFRKSMRNVMLRECLQVLLGGSSTICSIKTPILISGQKSYTSFVASASEEYENFRNKCSDVTGTNCKISLQFETMESDSFLQIETDITYTDYPFCLPPSCESLGLESFVTDYLFEGEYTSCDWDTSACNVMISEYSCDITDFNSKQSNIFNTTKSVVGSTTTPSVFMPESQNMQPEQLSSLDSTLIPTESSTQPQTKTPIVIPTKLQKTFPSMPPTFAPTNKNSVATTKDAVESMSPSASSAQSSPLQISEELGDAESNEILSAFEKDMDSSSIPTVLPTRLVLLCLSSILMILL